MNAVATKNRPSRSRTKSRQATVTRYYKAGVVEGIAEGRAQVEREILKAGRQWEAATRRVIQMHKAGVAMPDVVPLDKVARGVVDRAGICAGSLEGA